MLEPQDRTVLLEALRPPDGYELDEAIGTTFSLDLLALLTAPVGFTLLELQDSDRAEIGRGDELLLLRTLRRYADRLTIFCQAGYIAEPKGQKLLFSSLERSIVEVTAPGGGVFHPKVWVLRYVSDAGPIRYRVLVLSRNLTFATSWDTILQVDGELIDRKNAFAANHPLGDFVQALPTFAVRQVDDVVSARIDRLQAELRRVSFGLPDGVDEIIWHPLGLPGTGKDPFKGRIDRIAVVSPFLSPSRLDTLAPQKYGAILVSTLEQLQRLSKQQLAGYDEIFAMSPDAIPTEEEPLKPSDNGEDCSGLHAKLYVADCGRDASVWTGSANATDAAFRRNVEFLAELRGKKSRLGVGALLSLQEGITTFRDLLVPYTPLEQPVDDSLELKLEHLVDEARIAFGAVGWRAEIRKAEDGYNVALRPSQSPSFSAQITRVSAQPITLSESWREFDNERQEIVFTKLSLVALTPFFTFEVTVRFEGATSSCRFVVNAELIGEPLDRRDAILSGLLQDRQRLVRFLLLLLFDDEQMLSGETGSGSDDDLPGSNGSRPVADVHSLLEPLLRALHKDPKRLDQVELLLREFGEQAENGESLIPPQLRTVFAPIWAARQRVRQ